MKKAKRSSIRKHDADPSDVRCGRRLREVLGVSAADVVIILNLRRQVIMLQSRVRELEGRLAIREEKEIAALRRETYVEGLWRDLLSGEEE